MCTPIRDLWLQPVDITEIILSAADFHQAIMLSNSYDYQKLLFERGIDWRGVSSFPLNQMSGDCGTAGDFCVLGL